MAKKTTSEKPAATKRTPEEKAQRKADKAQRKTTKSLTDNRDGKKASQKQVLKAAAKQLRKELDNRMNEMVARVRKETKAKLKEVVKEATRRLDVDTEKLLTQTLHTIAKHYDDLAPGRTADITIPAPATNGDATSETADNDMETNVATESTPAPAKRPSRPAAKKPTASKTTASRPKSKPAATTGGEPELNTPLGTTNDSAAVDNV